MRHDHHAQINGELLALVDGRPSITALQQRMRTHRPTGVPVVFAVFDLLLLDDELLIHRAYRQRRALLEDLALPAGTFQRVVSVVGDGEALLAAACAQQHEGILAKRLDSTYHPGVRSRDWRKILAWRRLQVTVGGYIAAAGQPTALLVGQPDPEVTGRLAYLGRVDHGFTPPRTRRALAAALDPLETAQSPFSGPIGWGAGWGRPPGPPPRWVQPVVEVVVDHLGHDADSGQLRHP